MDKEEVKTKLERLKAEFKTRRKDNLVRSINYIESKLEEE